MVRAQAGGAFKWIGLQPCGAGAEGWRWRKRWIWQSWHLKCWRRQHLRRWRWWPAAGGGVPRVVAGGGGGGKVQGGVSVGDCGGGGGDGGGGSGGSGGAEERPGRHGAPAGQHHGASASKVCSLLANSCESRGEAAPQSCSSNFFLRCKPALRNYILPRPEGKPSSTQLWEVVGCALPWPPRRELPAAASTNITNHHPPTLLETLPSRLASRRRPSSLSLAAGGGTVGCNSPRRNCCVNVSSPRRTGCSEITVRFRERE